MEDRDTQARIARNEATFREANDRIEDFAAEQALEARPVPFICECADVSCVTVVRLTLEEYERVRADGRRFVVAAGHERGMEETSVLDGNGDYVIVEKRAHAGEVAEELADG